MRRFYYLPYEKMYINVNHIECIDIETCKIHFIDNNELRIDIREINLLMDLEQKEYYENKKRIEK